jgi:adenosylhomocysteine nucleosidase
MGAHCASESANHIQSLKDLERNNPMYKIGIICAIDREAAPFIPMIDECVAMDKAMLKFYSGKLSGNDVAIVACGIGRTNAAIATQILIDTFHCTAVVNAGTAGGMDTKLKLFDSVISTESAYWDVSQTMLSTFHPFMDTIYFKANEVLLELAKKAVSKLSLSSAYFGRMITGEKFIENEFRDEINANFSPLCVDMETAGIGHVCYVNKIPYLSVRTITDTAESMGIGAFDLNCDKASQISAQIVLAMIEEM